MDKKYDVYGIGNPLVDILARIDDSFFEQVSINKGVMQLISLESRNILLQLISGIKREVSLGGSCPNTMVALSDLGLKTVFSGAIGKDGHGALFQKEMENLGVFSEVVRRETVTGSSLILITPDAERTMNTYLGACQEFSRDDIDISKLSQTKILYFTGYMWDTFEQKDAVTYAIQMAKKHGMKIILDVADPFSVKNSKKEFLRMIREDVDYVFCNADEVKELFSTESSEAGISELMKISEAGAVKMGDKGSFVFQDSKLTKIEPWKTDVVDTTGAGDMYAAGIIYGIVKGFNMAKSGRIASFVSSKVVETLGARLDYSLKSELENLS